jgi:chromosomal replication initiation ATPase DnaA
VAIDPPDFETRADRAAQGTRTRRAYSRGRCVPAGQEDARNVRTSKAPQHARFQLHRPHITTEFAQESRATWCARSGDSGIPNIQKVVADTTACRSGSADKRRTRSLARPRQVAMALTKN